jgi:hypothetical protein
LREIAKLATWGKLMAIVDERDFALETIGETYRLISDGHSGSKLVVEIGQ